MRAWLDMASLLHVVWCSLEVQAVPIEALILLMSKGPPRVPYLIVAPTSLLTLPCDCVTSRIGRP